MAWHVTYFQCLKPFSKSFRAVGFHLIDHKTQPQYLTSIIVVDSKLIRLDRYAMFS